MTTQMARAVDTSFIEANIPKDLEAISQWVCWEPKLRGDKWAKVPVQALQPGNKASTTNPDTWTTFDIAARVARESNEKLGIGFVLTPECGCVGIDLDKCISSIDGWFDDWVIPVICQMDSYTEYSPSGLGLKAFVRGVKPGKNSKRGNVEMYSHSRFFTVTGRPLLETPLTVEHRQEAINGIYNQFLGDRPRSSIVVSGPKGLSRLDDQVIINRLLNANDGGKGARLWSGDISGYTSASEADAALCGKLWFYTGDRARVASLLRMSGLYRDKFDREDYVERTLDKVCNGGPIYSHKTYSLGAVEL